jgi:hypothetical protein
MNNEIIKKCKKHGGLTQDQIHPKGKIKTGKQYYGCKLCKKVVAKKYYTSHPEKIKEDHYNRYQKIKFDPEWRKKKKVWMANYYKRLIKDDNRRIKFKERNRLEKVLFYKNHREKLIKTQREMSDNLHPSYVKHYLKKHYGFENPSDELIKAKSAIMLLRREIMVINTNKGKNKYVKKTRKYPRNRQDKISERRIIGEEEENFKKL